MAAFRWAYKGRKFATRFFCRVPFLAVTANSSTVTMPKHRQAVNPNSKVDKQTLVNAYQWKNGQPSQTGLDGSTVPSPRYYSLHWISVPSSMYG